MQFIFCVGVLALRIKYPTILRIDLLFTNMLQIISIISSIIVSIT
jgi:hypothetical protein